MSLPLPDDWDNTTYQTLTLTLPDSAQWRAIIKGAIAELSDDYTWHEAADSELDKAVGEVGKILRSIWS